MHSESSLLGLPQEIRDQIYRELFHVAPTVVVNEPKKKQDGSVNNDEGARLRESLPPTEILYVSKQLHAEAMPELCKSINATRLVLYCFYPTLLKFLKLAPNHVKANIRKVYATSRLLFSYNNEWNKFMWKKQLQEKWSPICQRILENFNLTEFAIYTPLAARPYYFVGAPLEVCHLLETSKIQKVQFVYRDHMEYDQDIEKLYHIQRVLRGAHAYPNESIRHEKPIEFSGMLAEWEKLPRRFNVHREGEDACRDELWWAAGDVLARDYSPERLKNNGVRTIVTFTRREDIELIS